MATLAQNAFDAYVQTALWSSTDDDGEPLDRSFDMRNLDADTRAKMSDDLTAFLETANKSLAAHNFENVDDAQLAHDFWLTRNRHGAGFWDGDYPHALGVELTDISHQFGDYDLYVGDDCKIHGV